MFMKRTTAVILSVIAVTLALAAISCSGEPPTSVDSAAIDAKVSATAAGATHLVTGKGTTWLEDPWNQWGIISFNARQMPDGSAKGNWHHQLRTRKAGGRIFAKVTCLSVVGNEAWMAGYSTQAMNPANVGKWFGLHVIDNGEGHGVVDEMSRTQWFGADAQRAADFCALMPIDHVVHPLASGNVQVH